MARTAADVLIETLIDWDVDTIFGLPGDGINGIMESLRTHRDEIRFVQVRHEESAAFAATSYAKFTGRLGVCLATSGPGGLHLINGLYDAKLDGAPVLAITGHHYSDLIDTAQQQDVDLTRVFEDVTVYNTRVMNAAHVANVAPLACRTALAGAASPTSASRPTCRTLTADEGPRAKRDRPGPHERRHGRSSGPPADDAVLRAADVLDAGSQGRDPRRSRRARRRAIELERVADLLGGADRQAAPRQGRRARTTARTRPARSGCSGPSRPRRRCETATRC